VIYFAFTTLSTVGFGDYYPVSNTERAVGSMVLLGGVAVFTYFMGALIEILEVLKSLGQELEDGDALAKFFGMIRRFNNDVPLENSL